MNNKFKTIANTILILCFIVIVTLNIASCYADAGHITKRTAQKIATQLLHEEVTYVETIETDDPHSIYYNFTDSRGNTISIHSFLRQNRIDAATFGPLICSVSYRYCESVLENNMPAIMEILEKYGLTDYIASDLPDYGIYLKLDCGTPEYHRDILQDIATAAAEIDALLDISTDEANALDNSTDYYSFSDVDTVELRVYFYEPSEYIENEKVFVDDATITFTTSEPRWTKQDYYATLKKRLEKLDISVEPRP